MNNLFRKISFALILTLAVFAVACGDKAASKTDIPKGGTIAVLGSSVAAGYGATDFHGYAWLLKQELDARNSEYGYGAWLVDYSISVPGDTTAGVFARFDKDLLPLNIRVISHFFFPM